MSDFKQGEILDFKNNFTEEYDVRHPVTFVAEARGWCFVIDGTEPKLINSMYLSRPTFKPGLFRLNDGVSSAAAGQQIRWFDVPPSDNWVRVT